MKVSVCTSGISAPCTAVISNWPSPFTRKICSVMMAPEKMVGTPSAMTVTTGIRLLRSTCTSRTAFSFTPLARAVRT
ncbi:Uncharacterised protein [Mycobacterium tuberculosis]|nr:Uncharacterised protein [Mycobacterium tuberculosis]